MQQSALLEAPVARQIMVLVFKPSEAVAARKGGWTVPDPRCGDKVNIHHPRSTHREVSPMPPSGKDKSRIIEKDRKIHKITKMIKAKERELDIVEMKAEKARGQVAAGDLSKGDYQRMKVELGRDRKSIRGTITRLERSRLKRERLLKEKETAKEEKAREREERRAEKAREKELKKEAKASKSDEDG